MLSSRIIKELSELKGKDNDLQLNSAVSLILESPNGIAPYVFDNVNEVVRFQLFRRFHKETGLMNSPYFKSEIQMQIPVSGTYALIYTKDINKLKYFLKKNDVAPTNMIGRFNDTLVGALFLRSKSSVSGLLNEYICGFADPSLYKQDINKLHSSAFDDLQKKKNSDYLI